jgi:small-conductance mechanosensitive channel
MFLGNTTRDWLIALGVAAVAWVVCWLLKYVATRYLQRVARRSKTDVDDLIAQVTNKTEFPLLAIVGVYLGSRVLSLPPGFETWARAVTVGAVLIQVALWGDALITGWLLWYQKRQRADEAEEVTTVRVLAVVVRFAVLTLIALIALDNIPGIEVTTLVASLGIGGIAVALAAQNILADLFASLIIALDKPFVIGDFIKVDDFMGTVEDIGLKTTHVRSYTGEEVIFGNGDLLSSRLSNYKTLAKRLVISTIGVTCETPYAKLERIPGIVREVVEAQEVADFARAHLAEFGPSSYNYQVVYSVPSPDFGVYMDTRHGINLGIIRRFEEEGIEMAYPTQVVYVGERDSGE